MRQRDLGINSPTKKKRDEIKNGGQHQHNKEQGWSAKY